MNKRWFEDWLVERSTLKLKVSLPNGIGKKEYVFYQLQPLSIKDVDDLTDLFMSLFDQIERDNKKQ